MQERERILELVKKGILSTEEALVLLENIATEKDEKLVNKEASQLNKMSGASNSKKENDKQEHSQLTDVFEDSLEEISQDFMGKLEENKRQDKEQLEKILAGLAEEANQASVELDELSVEVQGLQKDIREKEEEIMVLNTMEDLETLSETKVVEREQLEKDLVYLKETLTQLESEKELLSEQLKAIKQEQKVNIKEEWKAKFELPDDWKDQANDTINQVTDKVGEAGSQFGDFLKKTIETVTKSVNDNVDWKDINIKVPGVASQTFTHEFIYPKNQATIVDVKVANGKVKFKTWESDDVKVEAEIKFYGKMNADSLFEAFLERSEISVTDEKISFQIPNKRMKADLIFYLPARMYDHISIKMLNGDVSLRHLDAGDIFLKSTNGDLTIQDIEATMLEVEGVNGEIEVKESKIVDLLAETVNGDVTTKANIQNIKVSLINGDVRVTSNNHSLNKVDASVVNGTVKLALPESNGIEGKCKTSFGNIKNRLNHVDVIREKRDRTSQYLEFRRESVDEMVSVKLNTTTGSIYLKDTEI